MFRPEPEEEGGGSPARPRRPALFPSVALPSRVAEVGVPVLVVAVLALMVSSVLQAVSYELTNPVPVNGNVGGDHRGRPAHGELR